MDWVRSAANPWGQEVWLGVSWDLMWLVLIGAVLFILAHAVWAQVRSGASATGTAGGSADGRPEGPPGASAAGSTAASVPERVERHSLGARAFHWLMSVAMLALLVTAFVPVMGYEFDWVAIHWMAGLLLLATVVFHVVHAVGWQDLWSMWVGPDDVRQGVDEVRHALSSVEGGEPARTGKYPVDHKLYHHAAAAASLVAVATGLLMMVRIDTPLWARNPYLLSDGTWGVVYVLHGVGGVALIGLVAAHIYFAIRPEKRWLTWSMVRGWITRDQYLAHFDPERWTPRGVETRVPGGSPAGGALADATARAPRDEV